MYCTVTQESKSELQVLQHGFKCLWGNFSVLVLLVEEAPVAPRAGTLLCAACGAVWRLGLCAHLRQQTQMSVGVLVFGMQQCSPAVCWLWAVVCLSFLFDFLTLVFDPMIFSAEWVKWMALKQYFSPHKRLYKCWDSFLMFCPGQQSKQMHCHLPEFNW